MKQTWRWFGPNDIVSVDDMLQAGVEGVVSALHHVPTGEMWPLEEIARRKNEIATRPDGTPSGLSLDVVESLPVSEAIKSQTGPWREHVANYKTSLRNLAAADIEIVCYNFMPILDWTRTDLAHRLPHGGNCMRFDLIDFAAFDLHILRRPGAEEDFHDTVVEAAGERFAAMDEPRKDDLTRNVISGLPGSFGSLDLEGLRERLAEYDVIDADRLRSHLCAFLEEVVPVAEEVGIRMCCHPDDPPFPLLGLPRVVSTHADYRALVDMVDLSANGVTLCSGSLGARADNDLPAMMRDLGPRVHFLHLRNVKREDAPDGGIKASFHEAEHLGGDTDMVALAKAVIEEEGRRRAAGRTDASIPFRPDHGQNILDDLTRRPQPGYPAIGRLKGLAELRGVFAALRHGDSASHH